jgi:hypothetical protein
MPEPPDDALLRYQDALMNLLASNVPVSEIQKRLREDEVFQPYKNYVESFEPRMIEVAIELINKWGQRIPQESDTSNNKKDEAQ